MIGVRRILGLVDKAKILGLLIVSDQVSRLKQELQVAGSVSSVHWEQSTADQWLSGYQSIDIAGCINITFKILPGITGVNYQHCFVVACPSNCLACVYDSTQGKTLCGNNQCEDQYANAEDGTCGGLEQSDHCCTQFTLSSSPSSSWLLIQLVPFISC